MATGLDFVTLFGGHRVGVSSEVPSAGQWSVGDVILNDGVSTSGSVVGWQCTDGGTPGTWRVIVGGVPISFATVTPGTETTGSLVTTGATWVSHTAVGACGMKLLLANAAATGDFATLRMRARADAAGATVCGNFSASAGVNNHGNLYAVQGYAQPNAYTNNDASNIVCGLYSCIDAGGTSSGRRWSMWTDEHSTTKASGGHYLHRLSHNGTIAIDGVWTIYSGGRLPYLFKFEDDNSGNFLTVTASSASGGLGTLKIQMPDGTPGYINIYSTP